MASTHWRSPLPPRRGANCGRVDPIVRTHTKTELLRDRDRPIARVHRDESELRPMRAWFPREGVRHAIPFAKMLSLLPSRRDRGRLVRSGRRRDDRLPQRSLDRQGRDDCRRLFRGDDPLSVRRSQLAAAARDHYPRHRGGHSCVVVYFSAVVKPTDNYMVFQATVDGVPMQGHTVTFPQPQTPVIIETEETDQNLPRMVAHHFFDRVQPGPHKVAHQRRRRQQYRRAFLPDHRGAGAVDPLSLAAAIENLERGADDESQSCTTDAGGC